MSLRAGMMDRAHLPSIMGAMQVSIHMGLEAAEAMKKCGHLISDEG